MTLEDQIDAVHKLGLMVMSFGEIEDKWLCTIGRNPFSHSPHWITGRGISPVDAIADALRHAEKRTTGQPAQSEAVEEDVVQKPTRRRRRAAPSSDFEELLG